MGCNVDDECSEGQICQIGASKPGGEYDVFASCIAECEARKWGNCEAECSELAEHCSNCTPPGGGDYICASVCYEDVTDEETETGTDTQTNTPPTLGTCVAVAAPPVKKEEKAIVWAGTWIVELDYTATVDVGFGNKNKKTYEAQAFTVTISGDNSALTATIEGGYELTGVGTDSKLNLNGDWPINDGNGKVMGIDNVNFPNNVQVTLNLVSDGDTASGTFKANGGANGKRTADGTVSFSR